MARIATVPRMSRGARTTTRLLVVSRGAKRVTAMVQRRLSAAFPSYEQVDFDPGMDLGKLLTSNATVVVAGGDGTVGFARGRWRAARAGWASSRSARSTTSPTGWEFRPASTGRSR